MSENIFKFKNVIVDTGNPDYLICDFNMLNKVPEHLRHQQSLNFFSSKHYEFNARIQILNNENGHLIIIMARDPENFSVIRNRLILGLESMKHYNFHLLKNCEGYFDSE